MGQHQLGPHRAKRAAGKGSFISSTHGEAWEKDVMDRLEVRTNKYKNLKCGIERPAGKCGSCGRVPPAWSGW